MCKSLIYDPACILPDRLFPSIAIVQIITRDTDVWFILICLFGTAQEHRRVLDGVIDGIIGFSSQVFCRKRMEKYRLVRSGGFGNQCAVVVVVMMASSSSYSLLLPVSAGGKGTFRPHW